MVASRGFTGEVCVRRRVTLTEKVCLFWSDYDGAKVEVFETREAAALELLALLRAEGTILLTIIVQPLRATDGGA